MLTTVAETLVSRRLGGGIVRRKACNRRHLMEDATIGHLSRNPLRGARLGNPFAHQFWRGRQRHPTRAAGGATGASA